MTDGPAASPHPDDDPCIAVAAQFIANQSGGPERVLALHRQSRDGRCSGCGQTPGRWPCALVVIARRAQEFAATRPTADLSAERAPADDSSR